MAGPAVFVADYFLGSQHGRGLEPRAFSIYGTNHSARRSHLGEQTGLWPETALNHPARAAVAATQALGSGHI